MSRPDVEVLVVGSGPTGVSAALALVEGGSSVLMLDVGHEDPRYDGLVPEAPFEDLRRRDPGQHRYLLGDDLEAVDLGAAAAGPQLTAPRAHVLRAVDALTPRAPSAFDPVESLARGGLGTAWGAAVARFGDRDLRGMGIGAGDLEADYDRLARHAGLSGEPGDLDPYLGAEPRMQPPLDIDGVGRAIFARYRRRSEASRRRGLHLGRARLAVLSRDLGDRKAEPYHDMAFYTDAGGSVWRPSHTLADLKRRPGFRYLRPWLVERFEEREGEPGVRVFARRPEGGRRRSFRASRLLLSAGVLGTARIALRSLGGEGRALPLCAHPLTWIPCLLPARLGRAPERRRHSLAQLMAVFDPSPGLEPPVFAEIHGYRSLLLHRLLGRIPAPVALAWPMLRDLLGALAILAVYHQDGPGAGKALRLSQGPPGGAELLRIDWSEEPGLLRRRRRRERRLLAALARLGLLPLRRMETPAGGSIHYGGSLPMSEEGGPFTVAPSGRLRPTRAVYVADASVLPRLPAKPPTWTAMAHAHRVGRLLAGEGRPS